MVSKMSQSPSTITIVRSTDNNRIFGAYSCTLGEDKMPNRINSFIFLLNEKDGTFRKLEMLMKDSNEVYKKPSYEFLFMDDLELYQNFNYDFASPRNSMVFEVGSDHSVESTGASGNEFRWTYKPE